jgi:putative DNA primase/helicase
VRDIALRALGVAAQQARAEDGAYQVKMRTHLPHGRQVNDRPDWVCLQNGILNLNTLELRPHDPDFFFTYALGVTYNPSAPGRCERWLAFLEQTAQTSPATDQLQEFAGYGLTRDTRFAKCLLLLGPGADGKSVFIKTIRKLVGVDNCSSVSFQDLEDQFRRASIYNKLLNTATEVGSKALESPFFKAIVTGDPIEAAFKHRDSFSFVPYCKLIFAANKMPRVLDNSDGFFRRLLPVAFKRQFLEGDPDYDPDLEEKLEGELSGIFEWAILGLHRLWRQRGFTDSEETRKLLMGYKRMNNPVLAFVEDQCLLGEACQIQKEELYKHYRSYCGINGYQPLTRDNFFRELYAAINSIRRYRPRVESGEREHWLKGIQIDPLVSAPA